MRAFLLAACVALAPVLAGATDALPLDELRLPPGFHIAEFARVPNAREMALGTNGTLFVGSMSAGKVYAITPSADGTHANKVGYRVVNVRVDGARVVDSKPFVSGWLRTNQSVWGRPVDVLVMADGALLVSDDLAGAIYRISWSKP